MRLQSLMLFKKTKNFFAVSIILVILLCFYSDKIWAQIESLYNSTTDQFAGISNLMSATASNDIDGVRFFSKAGSLVINQRNKGGATALHIACRESNLDIAKILIDNGANLNIQDNEGWTPLMRASIANNSDLVEYLLLKGAKANLLNSQNESALVHSAISRCTQCINHIIEKGNLIKNMNTLILKNQVADAFLIARNQENKQNQGVLESFLDYISKISPLIASDQNMNTEALDVIGSNINIQDSKINKFGKNFVLKNAENQSLNDKNNNVYSVLEDPNLPLSPKKQLTQISQRDIPIIKTKDPETIEPKTKYKLKSAINNDIAKQNEIAPISNLNKKPIFIKPIQEKASNNLQMSKPEPKKFRFKTGQQSLISQNPNSSYVKDQKSNDLSALKVQDLTNEPKSITNIDNQAVNANLNKKNQEIPPQETIFLIEKKSNKNNKNLATEKPISVLKNEEINQQMNQDFDSPKPANEVVKKSSKIFKFKKSSSPQVINSNLESDSIKLVPLEKKETLPSLEESIQKSLENKGSSIKKFKVKKSSNSLAPTNDFKQEEPENT